MGFARYITFVSEFDALEKLPGDFIRALRESGVTVEDKVLWEDEGWAITFHHGGARYRFGLRFHSENGNKPLEYAGWVERQDNRGFLLGLFGPKETYRYPEIEPIIQSAFARLPDVREVTWRSGDEK